MQIKSLFGLSSFPLTMLLFLAPIVLLCPTSLGAVRKVHEVNVHTWSDADGAIICIFSHFLLHKKQGIFSDSADLVKLLYYSLPGVEGKFQCLFYDLVIIVIIIAIIVIVICIVIAIIIIIIIIIIVINNSSHKPVVVSFSCVLVHHGNMPLTSDQTSLTLQGSPFQL